MSEDLVAHEFIGLYLTENITSAALVAMVEDTIPRINNFEHCTNMVVMKWILNERHEQDSVTITFRGLSKARISTSNFIIQSCLQLPC